MGTRFELLGTLAVLHDTAPVPVTGTLPRAVLAGLLLRRGSLVSSDELIEVVWAGRPPANGRAALHNHVMRLRRSLGADVGHRLRTEPGGYRIETGGADVDVVEFEDLVARGRRAQAAGDWTTAEAVLADARTLWRGRPFADLPDSAVFAAEAQRLADVLADADRRRVDAGLRLGRRHDLLAELRQLCVEAPLAEEFHQQLMTVLYLVGRQGEALSVFRALRARLVEELGVEPSPRTQEVHRRILSADPQLAIEFPPPAEPSVAVGAGPAQSASATLLPAPSQLPPDTRAFTGRVHELENVLSLLRDDPSGPGTVVISAIDGMAGVGKTALAVHAAHRLRARFPDGQLFVDLHGHASGLSPRTAEDALDSLLRALGVPPSQVPHDLEERAARYRARLAGTRTLIVLDDAVGAAQVRPLLPGTPGCLVLVTSRKRLTSLDDAHTLSLDVLPQADAAALLDKVAGPGRVPPDHPATAELLALCGHVPLAIRITAARLRHRRSLTVDDLVAKLRDENSRLEQLADEDRNVAAALESSFAALPAAERRLITMLGLIPGPDFEVYAAANLIATDPGTAECLLESLLDHHLLIQLTPGRYRFHDLVRLHARRRCASIPQEDRHSALGRLRAYYLFTAQQADHHLTRHTRPSPIPEAAPPVAAPELCDHTSGLAWLRAEKAGLLAVLSSAADPVPAPEVIALTSALAAFLLLDGPWARAVQLHQAAAGFAHEAKDPLAEANALWEAGRAEQMLSNYAAASALHDRALAIYRASGNRQGEANAVQGLARARLMTGDLQGAITLMTEALTLCRGLADRRGEANARWDLSRAYRVSGDIPDAAVQGEAALEIFRALGDRQGEANAVFEVGRVRECLGDLTGAAAHYREALEIFQELGHRPGMCSALQELGRAHHATGDYQAALDFHEQALVMVQAAGTPVTKANCLSELGRVHLALADHATATDMLRQALTIYQERGYRGGEASCRHELGRVHLADGAFPEAADQLRRAWAIAQELDATNEHAWILTSLAALASADPTYGEALDLYGRAITLARQTSNPISEARARTGRAHCLAGIGDREAALADARRAVTLYQGTGAAEAQDAHRLLEYLELQR